MNDPLRKEVSGPGSAGRQGNRHGDPRSRYSLASQKTIAESAKVFEGLSDKFCYRQSVASLGSLPPSKTLEDFVDELIRPILKQWLDAHLPDLVREIVALEVGKAARSKGV